MLRLYSFILHTQYVGVPKQLVTSVSNNSYIQMVAKDRMAMFEMWSSTHKETIIVGTPSNVVAYSCYSSLHAMISQFRMQLHQNSDLISISCTQNLKTTCLVDVSSTQSTQDSWVS